MVANIENYKFELNGDKHGYVIRIIIYYKLFEVSQVV